MRRRRVACAVAAVVAAAAVAALVVVPATRAAPTASTPVAGTAAAPDAPPPLVVVDPLPTGWQVRDAVRAPAGATVDDGDGWRWLLLLRTAPPAQIVVRWVPWSEDPLPDRNGPDGVLTWRRSTSSGQVWSPDLAPEDLDVVFPAAGEVAPHVPPGFVVANGSAVRQRLVLEGPDGPGGEPRSVQVEVHADPLAIDGLAVAAGSSPPSSLALSTAATGRRIESLGGWSVGGLVLVPSSAGPVLVSGPPEGDATAVVAAALRVVDDAGYREWASAYGVARDPRTTTELARGETDDGRSWRVVGDERDGIGTARLRFDRGVFPLDRPGDALGGPGVFVALASTAATVSATVDGHAVPVAAPVVAGRAVVVVTGLPLTGTLQVTTPLQSWRVDLAVAATTPGLSTSSG